MNTFKIIDQLKALSTINNNSDCQRVYYLDVEKNDMQKIFNFILQYCEEHSQLVESIEIMKDCHGTALIISAIDENSIVLNDCAIIISDVTVTDYTRIFEFYDFVLMNNDTKVKISIDDIISNLNEQDKLFLTLFGAEAAI